MSKTQPQSVSIFQFGSTHFLPRRFRSTQKIKARARVRACVRACVKQSVRLKGEKNRTSSICLSRSGLHSKTELNPEISQYHSIQTQQEWIHPWISKLLMNTKDTPNVDVHHKHIQSRCCQTDQVRAKLRAIRSQEISPLLVKNGAFWPWSVCTLGQLCSRVERMHLIKKMNCWLRTYGFYGYLLRIVHSLYMYSTYVNMVLNVHRNHTAY